MKKLLLLVASTMLIIGCSKEEVEACHYIISIDLAANTVTFDNGVTLVIGEDVSTIDTTSCTILD